MIGKLYRNNDYWWSCRKDMILCLYRYKGSKKRVMQVYMFDYNKIDSIITKTKYSLAYKEQSA